MSTIGERIKEALELRNMRQTDLVEQTEISKGALSSYISGKYEPKQRNIHRISTALNVNESWLMGHDVAMEPNKKSNTIITPHDLTTFTEQVKLPLIDYVNSNLSITSNENITEYVDVPNYISADYCLRFKGDSMIHANIYDGDLVYIKNETIKNGEIAAVIINNHATLKRIYRNKDNVSLNPENPAFEPLIYTKNEFDNISVLGKAVAFISKVR